MDASELRMKFAVTDGESVSVTAWVGDAQRGQPDFDLDGTLLVAKRPNSTSGSVKFPDGKAIRGKILTISTLVTISNPNRTQKTSVWYAAGNKSELSTHNAATSPIDKVVFYKDVIEFV